MLKTRSICALALGGSLLVAALASSTGTITAAEESKYPDLRGRWDGVLRTKPGLPGQPSFDAGKAWGKGQEAPLTAWLARPFKHAGPRQSSAYVTSAFAQQIADIEAGRREPVDEIRHEDQADSPYQLH